MTDTLWSAHIDDGMYDLGWETPAGVPGQWNVVLRLLSALKVQASTLGAISATIRVVYAAQGELVSEDWLLDGSSTTLAEKLGSCSASPEPLELTLSCQPLLWLSDDHVNVLDYDDSELFSFGRATLSAEPTDGDAPRGLKRWRLLDARVPLLSLRGSFGASPFSSSMGLRVCSECDLWRATRLDGEPNAPHGEANARLLAQAVEALAAATSAQIR